MSTGVVAVVCALAPAAVQPELLLSGLWLVGLLAAGRGETVAVRFLARARPLRGDELAVLSPAVAVLEEFDLIFPGIQFSIQHQNAVRTAGAGRRTVVVSRGLMEVIATRQFRPDEVAALLAHAIGRLRSGQTRYHLVIAFWLLPWTTLQLLGRCLGRVIAQLPLSRLAWRFRFIVGCVAFTQGVGEGRAPSGSITAMIVGLSYLVPWCTRRAELSAEDAADLFVATAGLGDALSRFLRRGPQDTRTFTRINNLQAHPLPTPHSLLAAES